MKEAQTIGRRGITRRRLVGSGATAALGLVAAAGWPARCHGKFYPGAAVLGIDLGGLSREEALKELQAHLAPFEKHAITYRLGDSVWRASTADLGLTIDYDVSLDQAWKHGRDDGLGGRYAALIFEQSAIEPLVLTLDTTALDRYLARLDKDVSEPARDARLTVEQGKIRIQEERAGATLALEDTRTRTMATLKGLKTTDLELGTIAVPPSFASADLIAAKSSISTLIGEGVAVVYGDSRWTVSTEDLAHSLRLPEDLAHHAPTLDAAALIESLSPIADEINHPPQNATVGWDGGLYAMSESFDGVEVDLKQLARDVMAAAATDERTVTLPLIYTPAAVDSSHLGSLGITARLGRGGSSFAGSSDARATNVDVAAKHVSHALIGPGETFSFNDALGPITTDEGYVEGKIILGDWYASDIGGGVCQVSTTVFRAALLAGLPFIEWYPHSFRLAFYELDGWPVGMDAAIYQPNTDDEEALDLRFTNPTDSWMLLQMALEGDTVVADLYGGGPGYSVDISDPHLSDEIAPPPPVQRLTDQLQPGEREQIQVAQPGITVTMTRRVKSGDRVISEDTFVSPYQAQPDVYLVNQAAGEQF